MFFSSFTLSFFRWPELDLLLVIVLSVCFMAFTLFVAFVVGFRGRKTGKAEIKVSLASNVIC